MEKGSNRPNKILIVDDDPENIHILMDNLEYDYEVVFATSGERALEIAFSKDQPDLILLDIVMPGMDGYEVCERLKAGADTWDIPVIFVSALGQEVDETKGLNLGAVDFITKPFRMPIVRARVKAALRLKQEMDNRILLSQKLEDLNKNLENRVRRKTAALKKAHKNLEVSEKKYRAIYENAIEGIFKCTPQGRLLDASPALARMLGYNSPQELLATVTDVAQQFYYRPQDRLAFKRHLDVKGEVWGFETQYKKKNSDIIWVMICAKSVGGEKDEARYYQGFVIDITARKQAEEALRKHQEHLEELVKERTAELTVAKEQAETAREQAESANAAKSDFLARMSHEIRTPLNAMTGLTHVVLKSDLSDEQRDYLNKVQVASYHLLDIINNILDFSKVEAGRMKLGHAPFDLGEVFERLADLFSNRVVEKDLELSFAISPKVPRQLTGDAGRLTQVLTNLIANSIKFTDSGEIAVKAEMDDHTENPAGQPIFKFSVTDTGIGIAADVRATLFEPFTQAESYMDRSYEGTGLGLAICRRIVELMGGRIWVESTPEKGSTFSFSAELEVRKEDESFMKPSRKRERMVKRRATESTEHFTHALTGRRVLVVEDSELNRDVAVALLKETGLCVETASNGRIAVEKVTGSQSSHYDAVLMDIQMPEMDGYEATRRIREWEFKVQSSKIKVDKSVAPSAISHQPSATDHRSPDTEYRIPIIAMTAHALKGEKEKCLDADMDDYLAKPIDEKQLHRMLFKWIPPLPA